MNGIISEVTSRSSLSNRQRATAIAAGVCLFSGFVAGLNIDLGLSSTNPFASETFDYAKINWISRELKTREFHFSQANESELLSAVSGEFTPYKVEVAPAKKTYANKKKIKKRSAMFKDLQLAYERFEKAIEKNLEIRNEDVFFDFQLAARSIRNDFITTIDPTAKPEVMVAALDPQLDVVPIKPRVIEESVQMVQASAELPIAMKKWTAAPKARIVVASKKLKAPKSVHKMNAMLMATPNQQKQDDARSDNLNSQAVTTQTKSTSDQIKAEAAAKSDSDHLETTDVQVTGAAKIAEAIKDDQSGKRVAASFATQPSKASNGLTRDERQKLAESLLALRLANKQLNQTPPKSPTYASRNARQRSAISEPTQTIPPVVNENGAETTEVKMVDQSIGTCDLIANHQFVKSNAQAKDGLDTQICPERREWISKEWGQSGWIKVGGPDHLSTLTLHPAANGGTTLLLDANALALIALKSGVRVARGMGVIAGRVPHDYKIEFGGRSEETEYFEINHEKYFAIVNAEPGAGVIHLNSEKNQRNNATVMTPVLEDTVTFLDLVEPQARNIGVQILKNATVPDIEVTGLSVGISTQGMQAITQSDGRAVLKKVMVEPGYPLFIDVASKSSGNVGPNYRYMLKSAPKNGFYILNQLSERTLYKWIKQLKTNLNDQSAMVVGFYNRKLLDGFKHDYQVRVMPKSNYYSAEPQNYTVLWNGKISLNEPLEGDSPRFMSVQIPEGLSQVQLIKDGKETPNIQLIPISPRVIHVITE